ncbi:MAG: hypothetical protein Q8N53_11785 [Longimicrobiales bacterium]|nr:hypothetical protein [Longimicrobiales bacterium]
MHALALALLAALSPFPGAGAAASVHDLHVSYGNAAVEGNVLAVRIRFFEDDLERAMVRSLQVSPEADAAFLAYFKAHFSVQVGGEALEPTLVGSGQDELDRQPVWWYAVQFTAPTALTVFRVRNTLLTEVFDDQTNIVKFVRFPDERQKTYSFGRGEESFEVRF